MKVIVDTSVWIDHFRSQNSELSRLLLDRRIVMHPVVLGEIACGSLRKRSDVLGNLKLLPRVGTASIEEILNFIDSKKLFGMGLGMSDVQILSSALLSDYAIFSYDKAMCLAMKGLRIPGI